MQTLFLGIVCHCSSIDLSHLQTVCSTIKVFMGFIKSLAAVVWIDASFNARKKLFHQEKFSDLCGRGCGFVFVHSLFCSLVRHHGYGHSFFCCHRFCLELKTLYSQIKIHLIFNLAIIVSFVWCDFCLFLSVLVLDT